LYADLESKMQGEMHLLNASLESAKCGSLSMRERLDHNSSVQRGYQRGLTQFIQTSVRATVKEITGSPKSPGPVISR